MFSQACLLCILAVALTSSAEATHIRTGKVTTEGEVETNEGMRYYTTDAFLKKPIVCWEDLAEDAITVDQCTAKKIRYAGNIDEGDFKEGNIVTFPVEDYVGFGCPLPPQRSGEKTPEVIFRKIEKAIFKKGRVMIFTTFIDAGEVVPTILLHMGPLVNSDHQIVNYTDAALLPVSRVNNIGVRDFTRTGSFTPFTAATISYTLEASGGICSFRFDLARRRVTWEQRIDIEVIATFTGSVALSRSASGQIFEVAIPGAGFSINIFLLGRVTAGFTAALDWQASIDLGAAAIVRYGARVTAGRRVELGLGGLSNSPIASSGSGSSGSVTFTTAIAVAATAEGFTGVRPVLAVGLELPFIPDAEVGLGATLGLKLAVGAREPPFPIVTSGITIGSACSTCHVSEGSLDVEGRRLSITATGPGIGDREFVIESTLFSTRIGTLCLFPRTCPAMETLPPGPKPTPATTPPVTTAARTLPSPRPSCPCVCTFSGIAAIDCARNPSCRTRGCGFLRSQCCN